MNYRVTLTEQASSDLKEIFKYIAVDLQAKETAAAQLDRIEKAILSLDTMPERFRVYDKPKWREQNLRIMPVDNYLVFYIPDHATSVVTVVRVMYGGRDIDRQLKNMQ